MNPPDQELHESARVKVALLQGVIYSEEADDWSNLKRNEDYIRRFFRQIGLSVVVDDAEGFAFLEQMDLPEGGAVPRLFRRTKLSYDVTLLGALLRERLSRFETSNPEQKRLILGVDEMVNMAAPFFPQGSNEQKERGRLLAAIRRLPDFGFTKRTSEQDRENYEVRRIVKARFPIDRLDTILTQLKTHADTVARS